MGEHRTVCRLTLLQFEDEAKLVRMLRKAIRNWAGNLEHVAQVFGVHKATVLRYVQRYGLQPCVDAARGDPQGDQHRKGRDAGLRGGRPPA